MTDLAINGTSLASAAINFHLDETRGLHASGDTNPVLITRFGRRGGIYVRSVVDAHRVPFVGNLIHTTMANRLAAEDALSLLLHVDALTVTYTRADASVRVLDGVLDGDVDITGGNPGLIQPIAEARFNVLATDPTWRDASTTTVTVAAAATDYACALGTADSWPVITILGNATPVVNPSVIIKDGAGVTVVTLAFTISLPATDSLKIDCDRGEIELLSGGPTVRKISALDSGLFPFAFLRSWYSGATAPSVRFTLGTGSAVYYKRYW